MMLANNPIRLFGSRLMPGAIKVDRGLYSNPWYYVERDFDLDFFDQDTPHRRQHQAAYRLAKWLAQHMATNSWGAKGPRAVRLVALYTPENPAWGEPYETFIEWNFGEFSPYATNPEPGHYLVHEARRMLSAGTKTHKLLRIETMGASYELEANNG